MLTPRAGRAHIGKKFKLMHYPRLR